MPSDTIARLHVIVGLASLASMAACSGRATQPLPVEEPRAHAEVAVPAPPDQTPPVVFANGTRALVVNRGGWQPTLAEAMHADAGAGDYIRSQRPDIFDNLSHYIAQIYGVMDGEHRLVQMNFSCNGKLTVEGPSSSSSPAPTQIEEDMANLYLSGPVRCHDGGSCCFSLTFDPATGGYGGMIVNGR